MHRDNVETPHTWSLTSLDLFRFSSSGFSCLSPLRTAGSEQLKSLKRLWKLLVKCSNTFLQFSSWQEGGETEEWGAVRAGKRTGWIWSLAFTKPTVQKRPCGRLWQLPFMLHCTGLYSAKLLRCGKRYWSFQSILFCSSKTDWLGGFASFLPTASCIFTLETG